MTRLSVLMTGLAGVGAAAAIVGCGAFARADAATFHVDFARGSDAADGLSDATAWKHAPGDPQATGGPARTSLRPGDKVLFAANVRYRGTIVVTASGSAAEPITFAGAGPDGAAIIDGSDPVTKVAPCRSQKECGGAAAWRRIVRIETPIRMTPDMALFTEAGPMRPAQGPDPSDDFYRDEPDDMVEVDGPAMSQGRVALPATLTAGLGPGRGRLALWVQPNRVVYRPILAIEGRVARFDPSGLRFYVDRPARAAVIDSVALLDRPGEYAMLPDGAVVAILPPSASQVSIGAGRGGFRIKGGASNVSVRDLGFENMADAGQSAPAGVAVFTDKGGSSGVAIENNRFRSFVMLRGQGPIIQRDVTGLRVVGNRIDTVVSGSGMRLSGAKVLVEANDIRRIGRTGVMLMSTTDGVVRRNTITDVRGIHGNALSAYLDNSNVRFLANTVTAASQPATFHGSGDKATRDNNIVFANNLFVATPDALGSLISWGGSTRGVDIRNNVLLGGKTGLRLNAGDTNVSITNNIASGLIVANGPPAGWRVSGNEWTALSFQQKREAPPPHALALPDAIESRLAGGATSEAICIVVTRTSPPTDPSTADVAKSVGARSRCP